MTPPSGKKYPKSTRKPNALRLVARQYSAVNLKQQPEYYDDTLTVAWGSQDDYEVVKQIGKGKYGEVYEGHNLRTDVTCVIKIMRPVKEHRLRREIKILRHVTGGPNIIGLRAVLRDPQTKTPCFVFDPVDAIGFKDLQSCITQNELRYYMYQPGNVLVDHSRKQLRLIDWGLADFYHPGKEYPVRVATRFYKGPELLCDVRDYHYSLDVWGVGCMMAALLFKKPVFFRGEDEFDQLVKISRVLGTDDLHRYCEKYGVELDPRLVQMVGYRPRVPWKRWVTADNEHLSSAEAFDLLDKLLRYDHHERATAAEAMAHEWFRPVREGTAVPGMPPVRGPSPAGAAVAAAVATATAAAVPSTSGSP